MDFKVAKKFEKVKWLADAKARGSRLSDVKRGWSEGVLRGGGSMVFQEVSEGF